MMRSQGQFMKQQIWNSGNQERQHEPSSCVSDFPIELLPLMNRSFRDPRSNDFVWLRGPPAGKNSVAISIIQLEPIINHTMKNSFLRYAALAVLGLSLTGCIAIGNRGALPGTGTLGQQLMDLQKAKDTGVITDAEFQKQRARLLKDQ